MKHKTFLYGLAAFVYLLGGVLGAWNSPVAVAQELATWTAATFLPVRMGGSVVQCVDDPDSFYLITMIMRDGHDSRRLYRYDIATGSWVHLNNVPWSTFMSASTCYQGKIYVAQASAFEKNLRSMAIYDIATNTWDRGPKLPEHVMGAALAAWNGKLYLVGGTRDIFTYTPEARVDVYDIATGVWTAGGGADMPFASCFFAKTQVGPYLYAVGGYTNDPNQNVNQTQRYDMRRDSWELGPLFSSARGVGGLVATRSHLYMLGGDMNGGLYWDITDQVDVLDLSSWPEGSWADLGIPLSKANYYPGTACSEALTGGEIWQVGGVDGAMTAYDDVYYLPVGEGCP